MFEMECGISALAYLLLMEREETAASFQHLCHCSVPSLIRQPLYYRCLKGLIMAGKLERGVRFSFEVRGALMRVTVFNIQPSITQVKVKEGILLKRM